MLIIVDYSLLLNKYFYSFKDTFSEVNGEKIASGNILGLTLFTERVFKKYPHANLIFAMDGKCVKKEINEGYKAQREQTEERKQVHVNTPEIINILCGVKQVSFARSSNHEADDLIANIAYQNKDKYKDIVIYSSDKDFWQLLSDFKISNEWSKSFKYVTDNLVFEKFGVNSDSLLAFRVLDGDASDNLKAPVSGTRKEFRREVAERWKDDLTIDNFIDLMYSYKDTKWQSSADKHLEAVDKVESNLAIMDLTKYKNPEYQFDYKLFRANNQDGSLLQKYGLRQFEVFLYDLKKGAKAHV
jgi:5'-3' exonuclease